MYDNGSLLTLQNMTALQVNSWLNNAFLFIELTKSWLELTPRSFVPLITLKSKVLPVQLAQDTAGS